MFEIWSLTFGLYTVPISHLVLIDGHHLMYRAYWAIPRTMKTSKGEQVNTVFGVASMIIQILKTEQPDSLLFCFDEGSDTFRHKEYEAYKDGRAETPQDFYDQIPQVFALIDAFGISRVSHPGFEADDLLCTYARRREKAGDRVTIVTGDRDALQLASDHIRIAIPAKGYQVPEYLDPPAIEAKYGVRPDQIPFYKGLTGDASDNLKGVTGIGPKSAAELMKQYGTIEDLYANLDKVKQSWREKLEHDRESAFFCKRMAELTCDAPMDVSEEQMRLHSHDLTAAFSFFAEKEFSLLTKRLQQFLVSEYGSAHFHAECAVPISKKEQQQEASQLSLL